jgi:amino acid permease
MSEDTVNSYQFKLYQSVPTALLLLLPLSLKRDMSAFRYVSLASIAALLYTGIVLIVELPKYYNHFINHPKTDVRFGFFDLDMFTGCAMTFFAFQCQVQLLPIYSELVNPEYRRVIKVIDRAIAVDLFFYMTIAVAGYLSSFN